MIKKYTIENLEIELNVNQVRDIVLEKLKKGIGYSIVRIGDGEIAVINGKNDPKGLKHFYYVHLGRNLPEKETNEILNNLKNSITQSDILGITPKNSEQSGNPYWGISKKILVEILNNSEQTKEKKFCSMGIHYELVSSGCLDEILKTVDELYLVTSRDVEQKLKQKFPNLKKITSYKIPGEYVYEDEKKFEDYYPTIYKKIESEFVNQNMNGKLLLIGGGFVGKNLCVVFANKGGVSIDLGSVFDNFVGKITRGKGKGPRQYRTPLI